MKRHIKLFEDFIREEDPLAGLGGGGNEKPKEDPLDAQKKKDQKAEKKADSNHNKMVDKKGDKIEDLLNAQPEVKDALGDKILKAIEKQDRVLIHNAVNDLIFMQQKYQETGNLKGVTEITKIKTLLDTLDKSFTSSKRI
jgi:hypothetical protein